MNSIQKWIVFVGVGAFSIVTLWPPHYDYRFDYELVRRIMYVRWWSGQGLFNGVQIAWPHLFLAYLLIVVVGTAFFCLARNASEKTNEDFRLMLLGFWRLIWWGCAILVLGLLLVSIVMFLFR